MGLHENVMYVVYLNVYHVLFRCGKYSVYRDILFSHFGEERITDEDILGKGVMDRQVYKGGGGGEIIQDSDDGFKAIVLLIPAHIGIKENELADECAA